MGLNDGSYTRYNADSLRSEVRCNSTWSTMVMYYVLVSWQLIQLLFVLSYGSKTRSAGKIFSETKCIYIGSQLGTVCFVAWGILILFTTDYVLQIAVRGFGSLLVVVMIIALLFEPKLSAVYRSKQKGADLEHKEGRMKRQYEANVKDPNGKELLLLLDAVVRELEYRTSHSMLSIELEQVDLHLLDRLLIDVRDLVPTAAGGNGVESNHQNVNSAESAVSMPKMDTISVPSPRSVDSRDKPVMESVGMREMMRLDSKSHTPMSPSMDSQRDDLHYYSGDEPT